MRRLVFPVVLCALALAGTAAAQPAPAPPSATAKPRTYQEMWATVLAALQDLRKKSNVNLAEQVEAEVEINKNVEPFLLFAHAQSLSASARQLEGARTDKQLGAPPAAGGSTSLVSRGSVPRILAFAVEHGAATQTINETSATVRGNAVGWLDLIREQGFLASGQEPSLERALRRVSYSFTFDVTPAEAAPTETRPSPEEIAEQADSSDRQLTGYSVRISILDQRDPRRADNRASGQALLGGREGMDVLQGSAILRPVLNSPIYRTWLQETTVRLSAPEQLSAEDLERLLYGQLERLRQIMIREIPQFDRGVGRFVKALRTFDAAQAAWFEQLQQRFVLAAEVVRTRPPSEAGTTTFRVVGEGRVGTTALDLTVNAAFTRQDSGTAMVPEPTETGGWRDIQFGVQAELPLGRRVGRLDEPGVGRSALAFEYLLRNVLDAAVVTFAGHDFAVESGLIHAAQAKVTIPMKGSGVKIPISISIANRTELLKEKNVRGHIGLTFDLDALTSVVRR